jgi:hypothetical protein
MASTTAPATKQVQALSEIKTIVVNGTTQYQVTYEGAVVARVDSLYQAQQLAHRMNYPVNQI